MFDRWLASLSKNTLAVSGILIGITLVVLFSPPHSVCDTQEELFREGIQKYFFIDKKQQAIIKKSRYDLALEACRFDGRPGSCYDLFDSLNRLTRELSIVTNECVGKLASIPQIQKALWEGTETMVKLAWGEKSPESFQERKGWLSEADISLFCKMQNQIIRADWQSRWNAFREKQFKVLPGADQFARNDAWGRMLFSIRCESYM